MALKDWPDQIEYRWQDETAGTPYALRFLDIRSAIAFIVSQGNNLRSADDILGSLFDPETGKSLADPSIPATADDVTAAAPQGTILPPTEPVEPEPAVDVDSDAPVSSDTTATANFVPTAAELSTPNTAGDAVVGTYPATPSVDQTAPVAESDPVAPTEYVPGEPTGIDAEPEPAPEPAPEPEPTPEPEPVTTEPDYVGYDENEDDDFDNVGNADDAEETPESAPSIGTPTIETAGVTGTSGTN